MDRFQALQVFGKVAETGGFASAGRALGMSPPSVTRIVSSLEDRLGVTLFVRTTRVVRLTEAGERFLSDTRRILREIEEAEESVTGIHGPLRGELRLTAPVLFGAQYIAPLVARFLDENPAISAQAVFLDRIVNLIDEGLDVGIRIGELPDSSLMAARVGKIRQVVCGAPLYLERNGTPGHPQDLATHRLIGVSPDGTSSSWPFQENGRPIAIRITPPLRLNANDAARDLAAQGWGLTRLRSYQVAARLAAGDLVTVLDEFELPPQPVHVIHQEGRRTSRKVRALVDFLVDRLRADPTIN